MAKFKFSKILIFAGALLVTGLSTVGAATVFKTVNAVIRPDIIVKLDNQTLSLKDGNGNTINPLIVEGSTYLPVRAIAEAVGLDVTWDSESSTVSLNRPEKAAALGVRGTVRDIVQGKDGITFLVEGKKQKDTRYDIATVTVNSQTILENVDSYSEIKEGSVVEVVFPDFVAESYPVMSAAVKLTVISNGEIGVRGTVKDIVQGKDGVTFLVEGKYQNDTLYDIASITVNSQTILENIDSYSEIKEGSVVEIAMPQFVVQSYPVMSAAVKLTVISNGEIGVRGTVKNIEQGKDGITFLVEGKYQNDTLYDIASITVNSQTILENIDSYSEIKEGSVVEIAMPQFVVQSYPVMSAAVKLTVISNGEIGVRGTVKNIEQGKDGITFLVEGKKESDTRFDIASITVNSQTILENIDLYSEIKEGSIVEVVMPEYVVMTYPVMSAAIKLKVIK
ncbi:hypothetical protein EHE19_019355 [Ruminiclostridium herbifermentans]|uniref:Copper amine oxidase-like N-terminal domain-containing protein n=1 Tax=Ruminiclostridium herbifermentans TaxID=2488810 RepID=A0A4U7J950_9FIRM|nr:stalk domain-containing protein [Ruminiclostridium herbifermentans]QNU66952.1 hypothetical protein EHE19_019355 [Ruminiclostridium herbifermentans]